MALFGVGTGIAAERYFLSARWRPLVHDLLNSDLALNPHEELTLFDVSLRFFPTLEHWDLANVTLFRSVVLRPVSFDRKVLSSDLVVGTESAGFLGAGSRHVMVDPRIGLSVGDNAVGYAMASYVGYVTDRNGHQPVTGPRLHGGFIYGVGAFKTHATYRLNFPLTPSVRPRPLRAVDAAVAVYGARHRQFALTLALKEA